MSLARYIIRRLLLIVPTLFGVSLLTFALSRIVPGDPARLAAGAQATPEMYAQIRQEFGLDLPLPVQYWNYLTGIVQGDWGRSILSRRPVAEDLRVYWPATLELVLVAMTIAVVIGVPLGVIAAVRADRPADQLSRLVALIGVSLPAFWLAILLQLFFGLRLGWFPISGRLAALMDAPPQMTGLYLIDSLLAGNWSTFGESLRQIILPAITLSFPAMATIMRFTRASLLEVLGQDYVRTARAKGAAERRVDRRARAAQRLDPDDHDDRALLRVVDGRVGAGGDGLRLAGDRALRDQIGVVARFHADHGDRAAVRTGLQLDQHRRRHHLRRAGPTGEPHMSAQEALSSLARTAPAGRRVVGFQLGDRQRRALRRFRQSPLSMVGLAIILILLAIAIVGPFFVPYPKDASGAIHIKEKLQAPSWQHLFGTDQVGRDVFTRVIVGARVSLVAGLVVISLAFTVGTLLGSVAGFFGGRLSEGIMRLTDIFLTIPDLILAMAFAAALGPGLLNVMIAVSLVWWPGYCRLARANVVALKRLAVRRGGVVDRGQPGTGALLPRLAERVPDDSGEGLDGYRLRRPDDGGARLHRPRHTAADA